MDIYHNEIARDILLSWERINEVVSQGEERKNLLTSRITGLEGVAADKKAELLVHVSDLMRVTSTSTPRCYLPLMVVRPTTPLLNDILNFDPVVAEDLKRRGAADCLSRLQAMKLISPHDERRWNEEID